MTYSGSFERRAGAGHRVDHQPVPGDDHFVVAARANALFARGKQLLAALGQLGGQLVRLAAEDLRALLERLRQVEDVAAFEVAVVGHIVHAAERRAALVAEHRFDFVGRPGVEHAFVAFAVGVFGAVEAAGRVGHVADDVVERLAHDAGVVRVAGDEIRIEIRAGQAARCRTASSRSAARASGRRPSSGRSRRRGGRRCRRPPSGRA